MTWQRILLLSAVLAYPVFGQLLSETDPSLPGNPPKLEVGITTCDDGSRWHAFTFQTIHGLPYVVESGNDLTGWTQEDSIYGFGQEEVVIMKQAPALPALPPPGTYHTPPPMIRVPVAQIIIRRGTSGGLVLSWKSLDDATTKIVFLPGLTQDPGWINMPGYVKRFDGYDFHLCNPLLPQTPPASNSTLGLLDTAMVAAFETNFPTMNAEVAAAVVRARSAPRIPAPPTERRFWRVRVDWGLDSDTDGTPDWMEFGQLFAAGAGNNPVAGPEPDPFNKDTNGDGIEDGKQRSSDLDGVADQLDADKDDGVINWEKTDPYRFALFPLFSNEGGASIQVNKRGDVLGRDNKIFRGGKMATFSATVGDVSNATAYWLDDTGRAYASSFVKLNQTDMGRSLVTWPPNSLSPTVLKTGTTYPQEGRQHLLLQDMCVATLADGTRSFIADAAEPITENGNVSLRPVNATGSNSYRWTLSEELEATSPVLSIANEVTAPSGIAIAPDGSLISMDTTTKVNGQDLGFLSYARVAQVPSGDLIAFSASLPPLIRHDNQWTKAKTLTRPAIDASSNTGFIFLLGGQVWLNGQIFKPYDVVPNLPFGSLGGFAWLDAAPSGFALAEHSTASFSGGSTSVCCLAVPIKVLPGAQPSEEIPFSGVDDVSVTATKHMFSPTPTMTSGPQNKADPNGWLNQVWIMVPAGSDAADPEQGTFADIRIPAMAPGACFKIIPKSDRITVTPDQFEPGAYQNIQLTATEGASLDSGLSLAIGHTPGQGEQPTTPIKSENTVIGVKIMKKRTVKIALHPMVLRKDLQADNPPEFLYGLTNEDKLATKTKLETQLNNIYGPQTNTFFVVQVLDPTYADYDRILPDNKGKGYLSPSNAEELTAATPGKLSPNNGADIDIWVLGGVTISDSGLDPGNSEYIGFRWPSSLKDSRVILNGDFGNLRTESLVSPEDAERILLKTAAHEIGHVIIGRGHPDLVDTIVPTFGPARLQGTDLSPRLMLSTGNSSLLGTLLVKAEWDEIEGWLKENKIGEPLIPAE